MFTFLWLTLNKLVLVQIPSILHDRSLNANVDLEQTVIFCNHKLVNLFGENNLMIKTVFIIHGAKLVKYII